MFRDMRRGKQLMSAEDTNAVMIRCTNGVLACLGDNDYPYAVPLSYVYYKGKIYFHSAKAGHKIDSITKNSKVSFSMIDEDTIVSEKYTTCFRSVIAFGKAKIVEGEERLSAFKALVDKYSEDQPEDAKQAEIAGCMQSLIISIDIEHVTGKESIDYVKAKR
ncbi:MAG: pyridoxamine 5'-phosphate oxidase family protein [Ruminococcaceae bacterium]|jgi:nitroimidazol reductase NimA-like FMN-containing flavoprotein (pyridoxamine 5'-phosphate oxidase superfamily)|nr:pyridoxamine 5'-phosphate oxidase family protein [Oscillospiraceae bacterium]